MIAHARWVAFPPRARAVGLALALAIALGAVPNAARAAGGDAAAVVAVLGFHDSRLADEIKRELESSRFEVLSAEIGSRRWQDVARTVDGGRLLRGVAVDENDRTLTVYTRTPGKEAVDVRLALSVDPGDRMARRHACLSVVELLHALSEAEYEPSPGSGEAPRTTQRSGARADSAARATPSPGAGTAPPAGGWAATTNAPAATPPPAASAIAGGAPASPHEGNWQLGVGTTFDIETDGGGPTSHLQFLGRIPATPHLALCARALWPLLATQSRNSGNDVRAWTFGAALSLQYTLTPQRRMRPFLGLGLGTRLGLTETTPMSAVQSRETFSFSGTLGIEAGVRYSLAPLVQVFFELAAARAWIIPRGNPDDIGRAAANGESARATVGVLFES